MHQDSVIFLGWQSYVLPPRLACYLGCMESTLSGTLKPLNAATKPAFPAALRAVDTGTHKKTIMVNMA